MEALTPRGALASEKWIWCTLSLFEPLASRQCEGSYIRTLSGMHSALLNEYNVQLCAWRRSSPNTAQRDVLPAPSQQDLFRAVGSLA